MELLSLALPPYNRQGDEISGKTLLPLPVNFLRTTGYYSNRAERNHFATIQHEPH